VLSARRSDHVVGRSDMHVERSNELWKRLSRGDKPDLNEMIDNPAEADIGQA
jgi:hypothetical protein